MGPTVMMATVLFAVQKSTTVTSAAMANSPPLRLLTWRVMRLMMMSMPPFAFTTSSIPPASMVTIMSSDIPNIPSLKDFIHPNKS